MYAILKRFTLAIDRGWEKGEMGLVLELAHTAESTAKSQKFMAKQEVEAPGLTSPGYSLFR